MHRINILRESRKSGEIVVIASGLSGRVAILYATRWLLNRGMPALNAHGSGANSIPNQTPPLPAKPVPAQAAVAGVFSAEMDWKHAMKNNTELVLRISPLNSQIRT